MAFLLAALRVRDPRVLQLLLDRLEYDAGDGAFCLGLYGDPAARPALEKMAAEVPSGEADLRREITYALEQLDAPEPQYVPEPYDLFAEYPDKDSLLSRSSRKANALHCCPRTDADDPRWSGA